MCDRRLSVIFCLLLSGYFDSVLYLCRKYSAIMIQRIKSYLCRSVALATVAIAAAAMPSESFAQFRWAAQAGVNFNNLKFKQDLVTIDKSAGFSAGVSGEMIFPGIGFGLDVGLHYEMTGAKAHLGERKMWSSQGYGDEQLRMHYAVIPLHLRFKWTRMGGLEEKIAPLVYVGPEFSILAGHSKCDAMDFAGGALALDMGGGFEIMRRWQLLAGYNMGMTYVVKAKVLTNYSARSRYWYVRAAYFF